MKRNNPATNQPFKYGDVREDGFIFSKYRSDRVKRNGYYGEKWLSPEAFKKDHIAKNSYKKLSAFHNAEKRAKELNRVPVWLTAEDKRQIRRFYDLAKKATLETGVLHHVDHIVPLQGDLVSGLHTPLNLQVISAKHNLQKSNKY